ncbi:ABC transporter permease [Oceanibacterium hippocampi]|uniref:Glutathione transport system permease protein GsiD n=1 Tax=Oceanibacterium hippocampi TaxID=745714 RepID=A0A1Y5TWN3_9PROT|nr:ABC transporter permease [Oceanibacterium hippocampi]SLN75583.1 Glutathione transport system permease protein GsiD [Oceanibacterium hippocampi]
MSGGRTTGRKGRLHAFGRLVAGNPQILFGVVVLVMLVAAALFAPLIAPYGPAETNIMNRLKPPSWAHLFGTDAFGRDVFSRVVHGARYSVIIGALTMLTTTFFGTALGIVSGYLGGLLDMILMRLTEAFMAIPAILLAIALIAILGNNLGNLVIALTVAYVPRLARIVRSLMLSLREELYVESGRSIGARPLRIVIHYMLPQLLPAILVQSSFIIAYAVIAEAGLSFLGVGVQPPAPSWGGMLSDGRTYMAIAPWITIFPGLGIMLIVLSLNQLGDGLRDALDPRLRNVT